jgi:hypothetical protein
MFSGYFQVVGHAHARRQAFPHVQVFVNGSQEISGQFSEGERIGSTCNQIALFPSKPTSFLFRASELFCSEAFVSV